MAFTEYTLSGNVSDLIGEDYDPAHVTIELKASTLIVSDGVSQTRFGSVQVAPDADGSFAISGIPSSALGLTYALTVKWGVPNRQIAQKEAVVAWFEMLSDDDLAAVVQRTVELVGISPTLAAAIQTAAALGATNDTATASFVEDIGSATNAAYEVAYATLRSSGAGDQRARINAFLSNVLIPTTTTRKLLGDFSVAGKITVPAGVRVDLEGTITQTSDNFITMSFGDGSSLRGGKLIGKGTDYVAGDASPSAVGAWVAGEAVSIYGTHFENHAGAGIYVENEQRVRIGGGVRIEGVGATIPIALLDDACFGIYFNNVTNHANVMDVEITHVSIGIIASKEASYMTFANVMIRDVPGQHGIYLNNGTGVSMTDITLRDIALNGIKIQLADNQVEDSLGTTLKGINARSCGDTALILTNSAADLTAAKKLRGVTLSGLTAYNCGRALYARSVYIAAFSNLVSYAATGDAFTFIDCREMTVDGLVSTVSGRVGLRLASIVGSSSRRVFFSNVQIKDPCGTDEASYRYGVHISSGSSADWGDLTIDGLHLSSTNLFMDYGLYFAEGEQETFSLRNARIAGATDYSIRLAEGPRAVRELTNIYLGGTPTLRVSTTLVQSGTGLVNNYFGPAAPTTGTWLRGDRVWNNAPAASGVIGWVCVTAGTPGTWKSFGAIAA